MKKLFFLLLLVGSTSAQAQFDIDPGKFIDALIGPCESDRPGQALNPTTAGMAAIQVQTGYGYQRFAGGADNNLVTHFVPTTVRLGITKMWEINTSFNYINSTYSSIFGPIQNAGFTSPELGMRCAFLKGDGWKPYLALQANMSFASDNGDFQQTQMGSSFFLATSNRFDFMSVNTNFGIRFSGNGTGTATYPWVVNFGWMLTDKLGTFVEGFGEFSNETLNWDAGFSYMVINDLQLDLFGGMFNITNQQDYWFAEFGVTYRFSFLKMFAKKKAGEMMEGFGS